VRIDVVTSLFPGPPRPREGVFAERRWSGMAHRGHRVRVIQPVPWVPPFVRRGPRAEWREFPEREQRGPLEVLRPRYLHLPGMPASNAARFARCGRARLDRPDVVVADYAWPAARLAPALARAGVPCVIHGRGSDVLLVREHPALARRLAEALRCSGHWCAVSRDLVAALDDLAERPGHGVLTPNGVETERFAPGDRSAARERLQRAGDERPWVLVVGHWIERKDPLLALEAFRRGAPRDARLFLVGRGPLEAQIRAASLAPDLDGRVTLVGEAAPEELADWYRASQALLLTSSREGRPNVVLEAFASGCPVVATAAGGTAELFDPWTAGLVTERQAESIADTLAAVLAAPPTAEELLACVRDLTWERSFEALEGVLEAALAETDPAAS
jgi:teichuronic acid biosynthesis glycosyltransferase TuaC